MPGGQKSSADNDFGGEIEIEKVSHLEIEIKRKDLLPVFEHFHKVKPDWSNRYKYIMTIDCPTHSYSILTTSLIFPYLTVADTEFTSCHIGWYQQLAMVISS